MNKLTVNSAARCFVCFHDPLHTALTLEARTIVKWTCCAICSVWIGSRVQFAPQREAVGSWWLWAKWVCNFGLGCRFETVSFVLRFTKLVSLSSVPVSSSVPFGYHGLHWAQIYSDFEAQTKRMMKYLTGNRISMHSDNFEETFQAGMCKVQFAILEKCSKRVIFFSSANKINRVKYDGQNWSSSCHWSTIGSRTKHLVRMGEFPIQHWSVWIDTIHMITPSIQ